MGNNLNELASYFEPLVFQLIQDCSEAGIDVRVVDTGRTTTEQVQKIAQGVSWTTFSKHEPQPPEMKSEAVDIVPLVILGEKKTDWDPTSPLWDQIGLIGERLGLKWGGRWSPHRDPSHFEYINPSREEASKT